MVKIIELKIVNSNSKSIFVNIDNIITIKRLNNFTEICFNCSVTGQNGGYIHYINVEETPEQIISLINK